MKSRGYGVTDVGQQRSVNEDALLLDDDLGLYVVCDGMGGSAAGEVASARAVEILGEFVRARAHEVKALWEERKADSEIVRFIEQAIQETCSELYHLGESTPEWGGMGTTMTMLLVLGDRAVMGHVGDSRLYIMRDERIWQLSCDHTMTRSLARMGLLDPRDAKSHRMGHVLTRVLGTKEDVAVDTLLFDLLPYDRCVLCTDGLSSHLHSADEIEELASTMELSGVPQRLVDLANKRGGSDNVTVLAVEFQPEDPLSPQEVERTKAVARCLTHLRDVYLFGELPPRDLLRLHHIVQMADARPGEVLVREGDVPAAFYVVIDGEAECLRGERTVGRFKPGDAFGVETFAPGHPSLTTVRSTERMKLLALPGDKLERLMDQYARIGLRVYRRLCHSLLPRTVREE